MINKLILTLLILVSQISYARGKPNSIYDHIIKLNPKINKEYAQDLAKKIARYSAEYKVDPRVAVAIMKQESSLLPKNHRRAIGLDEEGKVIQIVTDVGLWQVNVHSVKAYDLNAYMLINDEHYQLWAGFKILGDKVRQCATQYPGTEWACFHSATPKYHWEYVNAVRRWL